MPAPFKAVIAKRLIRTQAEEPEFVTRHSKISGPRTMTSQLHPTAMTEGFEPEDEEGDEPDAPSAPKKKKKSNTGVLIAGAAVIGLMALKR